LGWEGNDGMKVITSQSFLRFSFLLPPPPIPFDDDGTAAATAATSQQNRIDAPPADGDFDQKKGRTMREVHQEEKQ
jgi:hypothetical protein